MIKFSKYTLQLKKTIYTNNKDNNKLKYIYINNKINLYNESSYLITGLHSVSQYFISCPLHYARHFKCHFMQANPTND